MITRTYEWLIAAKFKPDNATVEIRQKIAAELLKSLDDGKDASTLVNYCVAACAGCKQSFTSESPFIKKLIETIRKHQAAFPTDLNDNALDIQVLCAVVIGELLSRSKIPDRDFASAAASLIVSALGLRSAAAGKYAVGFLNELLEKALKYLANRAESVRERYEPSIEEIKEIEAGADLPAFWKELQSQLVNTLDQLNSNAQTDREELEVLWWFYKRESKLAGKRISELPINVAALIGAVEVSDCVILPPHQGTMAMLWDAVSDSRPKTDLAKRALKNSIADWDATSVDLFLQDSEEYKDYITNSAAAFPLSWICLRLKESDYATTWDQEFEKKSGISSNYSLNAKLLLSQVFHERIALRMLLQVAGE
jgi:GTPase-associated system helical domain